MSNISSYDFVDNDAEKEVEDLGKKLLQAGTSKDALVKLLKQASTVLEKLGQDTEGQQRAKGLVNALQDQDILKHKDKDVQIRAALCLCHALRLHAPEPPYPNATLKEIFMLFLKVFRRLENPRDPNFDVCHSLLANAAQYECCLLMMDLDDAPCMVNDLFKSLLETVSQENISKLEEPIHELLASMLMEAEEIPQDRLDIILGCLLPPACDDNPAAARLVHELVRRTEARLQPVLQKFLSNVIDGQPTDSDLRDEFASLIYQVYRICPQVLLPVLPQLSAELQVDDDAKRLAALQLVGQLFALPGSDMDQTYGGLFDEFLRRTVDHKISMRQAALELCPEVLRNCSSAISRQKVLAAMVGRIADYEDKVRGSAIAAICTAAANTPDLVELKVLEEEVGQRLRDVKVSVRKEAAQYLMHVFRSSCERSGDADVICSEEEQVIWIPGRLCLAAARDPELSLFLTEHVFKNGLLPPKLLPPAAARQWGTIYMESSTQERQAIMRLVRTQSALQSYVRMFVQHRTAGEQLGDDAEDADAARTPPPPDSAARHLAHAMRMIASTFPDAAKAQVQLNKLRENRDNNVFKNLVAIMDPVQSAESVRKLAKELVQRVGSRGAQGDFCRALCSRLGPALLPAEQLQATLDLLLLMEDGGSDFSNALAELLVDVAAAAPQNFSLAARKVVQLLDHDDLDMNALGAKLLARAGRHVREAEKDEQGAARMEKMVATLVQLSQEGPAATAKAAIRGLVNVLQPQEVAATLEGLCREVMDTLEDPLDPNLGAKLQTLSGVGRLAPSVFGDFAGRISSFVIKDVLMADFPEEDSDSTKGDTWGSFTKGTRTKANALKVLARAFVPDSSPQRLPPESMSAVEMLILELASLLDRCADPEFVNDCNGGDLGLMRLTAASALLRLARAHDTRIQPPVFFTLALTIQDTLTPVRKEFAGKVRRTVQVFQGHAATAQKAAKYAAILPLAGVDPVELNGKAAFSMLQEFVGMRRVAIEKAAAANLAKGAAEGNLLHEHPEFVLPFLAQILAHHPDFPLQEDLDTDAERELQPFVRMLQFGLEALLLHTRPGQPAGSTLPAVIKILRTLKSAEDITAQPATQNLYLVSDLALGVAAALVKEHCKGAPPSDTKVPGATSLPKQFFGPAAGSSKGRQQNISALPQGFQVDLGPLFMATPLATHPHGNTRREAASGSPYVKAEEKARTKKRPAGETRLGHARSKAAKQSKRGSPSSAFSGGHPSSLLRSAGVSTSTADDNDDDVTDREPTSTRATSVSAEADPDYVSPRQRSKRHSSDEAVEIPEDGPASTAKRFRRSKAQDSTPPSKPQDSGRISPDYPFSENDASLSNLTPSQNRATTKKKKKSSEDRPPRPAKERVERGVARKQAATISDKALSRSHKKSTAAPPDGDAVGMPAALQENGIIGDSRAAPSHQQRSTPAGHSRRVAEGADGSLRKRPDVSVPQEVGGSLRERGGGVLEDGGNSRSAAETATGPSRPLPLQAPSESESEPGNGQAAAVGPSVAAADERLRGEVGSTKQGSRGEQASAGRDVKTASAGRRAADEQLTADAGGAVPGSGEKQGRRNRELQGLLGDMAPPSLDSGPRRCRARSSTGAVQQKISQEKPPSAKVDSRKAAQEAKRGKAPASRKAAGKGAADPPAAMEEGDPYALPSSLGDNTDDAMVPEELRSQQGQGVEPSSQVQATDLRAATSEEVTGSPAGSKRAALDGSVAKKAARKQEGKVPGVGGGRGKKLAKGGRRKQ